MREYKVTQGKLAGVYNVYDSPEEFRKHHPDKELYRWGEKKPEEMKKGDWVRALDDFVCQILMITCLKQVHQTSHFVRFPMATIAVKLYKGKLRYYDFYALYTLPWKGSLRKSPLPVWSKKDLFQQKVKFVALIMANVHPVKAYKEAFGYQKRTLHAILYRIAILLHDEAIGELLMQKFTEVQEKINSKITDDDYIEKIVKHWEKVDPGDKLFIPTAKFIGDISGKLVARRPSNGKQVEEAEIVDEEPPRELPE